MGGTDQDMRQWCRSSYRRLNLFDDVKFERHIGSLALERTTHEAAHLPHISL